MSQIKAVDSLIHDKSTRMKFFRPGFGYFNNRLLRVVKKSGYQTVLGDVYPHDYYIPIPALNAYFITKRARPGSIIVLHDLEHSLTTLNKIIPKLKQENLVVTTLSKLATARC